MIGMHSEALLEALPDLVILLRRDGLVLAHAGGRTLEELRPAELASARLEDVWPTALAELVKQLARKTIAARAGTTAQLHEGGRLYDLRVSPRGPDRVLCVVRAPLAQGDPLEATDEQLRPHLDRRGFLRRLKESMALAALREQPTAVAVIHVDGITDIAQIIAGRVAEQVLSAALMRLPQPPSPEGETPSWYLGQLSDCVLALVLSSADRSAIEERISRVCASLRAPVCVGSAEFHLTPYAGVAILGQDASSPKMLLEHAQGAAGEARRSGRTGTCFFTDTLRLHGLARLDIARELSQAIANRDIRLRYVSRHDLASGRRVAWVGYLRWLHPLRGEIRPAEFLRVAETTGLATALSRAVLACVREDFETLRVRADPDLRISFGALRHHILHEDFAGDIANLLKDGGLPPEQIELRISEKSFITRAPEHLQPLARLGVRLVVDEVGRGMGSLDWLARAPLWGLQLDRAWVTALQSDDVAQRVCRAGIGMALALGLVPLATGVDDRAQRDALVALGCRHGLGDFYREAAPDRTHLLAAAAAG
jgi:EAL domain-containing protein (putative c-di-GMP-specific phosphodiesterase class I)/GGDEF domain-containing protein